MLNVNQWFGGTCHLHLQGQRISQGRNQHEAAACYLFRAGFLLHLFFNTEGGSNMFLETTGWLATDYTASYPRRQNSL
jgi:hypothetical protein